MVITAYSILDCAIGIIICGFALGMYILEHKSRSIRLFITLSLLVSLWIFCIGTIDILTASGFTEIVTILIKTSYFIGTLITSIFFLFSLSYPYNKKINCKILILLSVIQVIFIYFYFFTNYIVRDSIIFEGNTSPGWSFGSLWFLFDLYFFVCWSLGISIIINKLIKCHDKLIRLNLRLVSIALIIGIVPPAITTVLLPRIGIFNFDWISSLSNFIWVTIITYAITRHHLFNIKVITVEIVVFSLWIFLLIRTLFTDNLRDFSIEGSLFLISVILGIILIKAVLHAIQQREKIEKLTNNLQEAYSDIKDLKEHLEEKTS